MTNEVMAKIEVEVAAALETAMSTFCKEQGITRGWSVAQHAKFQFTEIKDILDSELQEDERNFRVFIVLRKTANYSAWRQSHEGEGKPLAAGVGRGSKSLLAEYV